MTGEQFRELTHSGPDVPQCCVCNHAAEHRCAMCRELVCGEDARSCEFCDVLTQADRQLGRVPPPAFRYFCGRCVEKVDGDCFVCEEHKPAFLAEAALAMKAERAELADDLRRCQAKLASEYPAEQRIGFAESMVERWIGRLSA